MKLNKEYYDILENKYNEILINKSNYDNKNIE